MPTNKTEPFIVTFQGLAPGEFRVDASNRYDAITKALEQLRKLKYPKTFYATYATAKKVNGQVGRPKTLMPIIKTRRE